MLKKFLIALPIALLAVFVFEYVSQKPTNGFQRLQQPAAIDNPVIIKSPKPSAIGENARVIGIVVEGTARAYLVDSFVYNPGLSATGAGVHVVNDVINNRPISITYCDMLDCTRVFSDSGTNRLEIKVVGFKDNSMMLGVDGKYYPQTSKKIRFGDFPYEDTTWKKWLQSHPNSQLYAL